MTTIIELARLTASRGFILSEYPSKLQPHIPQNVFDEHVQSFNGSIGRRFRKHRIIVLCALFLGPLFFTVSLVVLAVCLHNLYLITSLLSLISICMVIAYAVRNYSEQQTIAGIDQWLLEKNTARSNIRSGINWRFEWDERGERCCTYIFAGKLGILIVEAETVSRANSHKVQRANSVPRMMASGPPGSGFDERTLTNERAAILTSAHNAPIVDDQTGTVAVQVW